jgi:glutathione S-transferase
MKIIPSRAMRVCASLQPLASGQQPPVMRKRARPRRSRAATLRWQVFVKSDLTARRALVRNHTVHDLGQRQAAIQTSVATSRPQITRPPDDLPGRQAKAAGDAVTGVPDR